MADRELPISLYRILLGQDQLDKFKKMWEDSFKKLSEVKKEEPAKEPKKCSCNMQDLLVNGCKCGGK